MQVDRFFIQEQYDLCQTVRSVGELQRVYRQRDVTWPVCWDTETTGLVHGEPSVLYDPTEGCEISRQLHPVVFGVSAAIVTKSEYVKDGTNGMWLVWARRGTRLFDTAAQLLADDADKLWHNAKYDLRVCEVSGIRVGGRQDCSMVMSRMFWNRRRSVGLKKLTEFLCPGLSQWDSVIGKELTKLKRANTKLIKEGVIDWPYAKVDYTNYSFVPEVLMGRYASLDVFMTLMLWMRLQGEAQWR